MSTDYRVGPPADPAADADFAGDAESADIAAAFAGAHSVWDYLPVEEPKDRAAYEAFLASMVSRTDIVPFAVVDKADGKVKGHLWLMEIRPAHGVFEVGFIAYSPSLQRTRG